MDDQESEKSGPLVASRLRRRVHDLVPALLVTAATLLVVEHWKHFDATDLALLVLILASGAIHLLTCPPMRSEGQGGNNFALGRKRRQF